MSDSLKFPATAGRPSNGEDEQRRFLVAFTFGFPGVGQQIASDIFELPESPKTDEQFNELRSRVLSRLKVATRDKSGASIVGATVAVQVAILSFQELGAPEPLLPGISGVALLKVEPGEILVLQPIVPIDKQDREEILRRWHLFCEEHGLRFPVLVLPYGLEMTKVKADA